MVPRPSTLAGPELEWRIGVPSEEWRADGCGRSHDSRWGNRRLFPARRRTCRPTAPGRPPTGVWRGESARRPRRTRLRVDRGRRRASRRPGQVRADADGGPTVTERVGVAPQQTVEEAVLALGRVGQVREQIRLDSAEGGRERTRHDDRLGARLPIDLDQAPRPHAEIVLAIGPLAAAAILSIPRTHPVSSSLNSSNPLERSSIGASASVVASVVTTWRNVGGSGRGPATSTSSVPLPRRQARDGTRRCRPGTPAAAAPGRGRAAGARAEMTGSSSTPGSPTQAA